MLRVRSFCTGKELLLCTSKLDGTLLGYVCNTGTIERLAYEEYEGFITLQVPQGVSQFCCHVGVAVSTGRCAAHHIHMNMLCNICQCVSAKLP